MSALGHKRTLRQVRSMSALPPIADIDRGEEGPLWATCDQRGSPGQTSPPSCKRRLNGSGGIYCPPCHHRWRRSRARVRNCEWRFVTLIGIWLLYRAVRHRHDDFNLRNGTMLAVVTGAVPCPLTTFIMVYAVSNGIIAAGLLLTASMALGMVATIALFAIATVLLRQRILHLMERTTDIRERAEQTLEFISAAAITGFGLWLLTSR
jgi:hypothetical protein